MTLGPRTHSSPGSDIPSLGTANSSPVAGSTILFSELGIGQPTDESGDEPETALVPVTPLAWYRRPVGALTAAAAAVLLAVVLAARVLGRSGVPGTGPRWAGLRARSRARRMPRQIDPDAAGRPRPRAPGLPSAA